VTKKSGYDAISKVATIACYRKDCQWSQSFSVENVSTELPIGSGKAVLQIYQGKETSDAYQFTFCPSHTRELLESLEPMEPRAE
jgi:hypothetical protein